MDEKSLLAKKENPVAIAAVCVKRMLKAKKDEQKRYQYARELLKMMKGSGYSMDTALKLMQFIEGITGLNTPKLKNALENDLDQEITEMLGGAKDMTAVQTPILRKVLRRKAQEMFRAEGMNEGKKEGKEEGKKEGKLEDARRMLARGMEIDVIVDVTELPEEEIRNLQNETQ
jgi:predicted transposase/invertase (TIGR01784 family)